MREQWGRTSRNHCFISSTGQWVVLMKLRWMLDSQPQGSPGNAALTLTMRAPMSLTERCHFKRETEKSKEDQITAQQLKPMALRQKNKVTVLQLPLKSTAIPNYMHFYWMRGGHIYYHLWAELMMIWCEDQ